MRRVFAVFLLFFVAGLWVPRAAGQKDKFMKPYKFGHQQIIVGNLCLKVNGKSGQITILRRAIKRENNATANGTDASKVNSEKKPNLCKIGPDKKLVTIRLVDLVELNQFGIPVGLLFKRRKHQYKNFTNFRVSETKNAEYQNLSAYRLAFASIVNGAEFRVIVYIFNETGNITNGEEVKGVTRGTVKFTVEVNNWLFCGDNGDLCGRRNRERGKQLELALRIKGKKDKPEEDNNEDDDNDDGDDNVVSHDDDDDGSGNRKEKEAMKKGAAIRQNKNNKLKKYVTFLKNLRKRFRKIIKYVCYKTRRCGKRYNIGSDDNVVLFKTLLVDGNYTSMPEGYPRLEKRGSDYLFVVRFPKGQNISYDPTVDLGPVEDQTSETEINPKEKSAASPIGRHVLLTVISLFLCLLHV